MTKEPTTVVHEVNLSKEVLAALPPELEVPAIITDMGREALERFLEFFAATLRTRNTKAAYAQAVKQFFRWCEKRKIRHVSQIRPLVAAAYVDQLQKNKEELATVKLHVSALRKLFKWLVAGNIIDDNPFIHVETEPLRVEEGKTPILSGEQVRALLDSIDASTLVGLRDRAICATALWTWARASTLTHMKVRDYFPRGKHMRFRLHRTKGGKTLTTRAHPLAQEYVEAYMQAAGIADDKAGPLFRTGPPGRNARELYPKPMSTRNLLNMIKRRARDAGIENWDEVGVHSWRATGITLFLNNGGNLERAQKLAGHADSRTTKLYHREDSEVELDDILKIQI